MDMDLSPSQQLLKENARTFLERSWSVGASREIQRSDIGYSKELWAQMADLGWLGLALPEQYGGAGGNLVDQVVLAQEFGRVALPSPYLTTVVDSATLLLLSGTEEQKSSFLPAIADGALVVSFCFLESDLLWDPDGVGVQAAWRGGDLVLRGAKRFVPYVAGADYLLCVARLATDAGDGGERPGQAVAVGSGGALVAAMVPRDAAGVGIRALPSSVGTLFYEVSFEETVVPWANVVGGGHVAKEQVALALQHGAMVQAGYAVGMDRRILETAVDYSKVRVQFGRLIGSYQGVQYRLVDMLCYLDAAELMMYQAAWRLSEGLPAAGEVAMAKGYVNESTFKCLLEGHDVFGGVGFVRDHEMDVFTRQGAVILLQYGDTRHQREGVARAIGL